jgi:hypothetical protein
MMRPGQRLPHASTIPDLVAAITWRDNEQYAQFGSGDLYQAFVFGWVLHHSDLIYLRFSMPCEPWHGTC